jgi:hypothetical protein
MPLTPKTVFRDPADKLHPWLAFEGDDGRYRHGVVLVGDGGQVGQSNPLPIGSGPQRDAFGRLRVSEPVELFSAACEYDAAPRFYETVLGGSAFDAYSTAKSGVTMSVTANASDFAVRQSRHYVRYRPGKSQQVFITANFNGAENGVVKRAGYFDDSTTGTGDGVFFEVTLAGIFAVLRSSVSGVSSDTIRKSQAQWSIGLPSGVTLDLTKQQVMVLDFGWLGSAVVRWGFVLNGQVVIVHEEYPSNSLSAPYMSKPSLPVRWEIRSSGSAGSMVATCAAVQSEGGFFQNGVLTAASRGSVLALSATALRPLLSVRLKATHKRGLIQPEDFEVFTNGASPEDFEWFILFNATLTGATFAVSASSAADVDVAATAVSGGQVVATGFGSGGGGPIKSAGTPGSLKSDIPLSSSYSGTIDTLTLAVKPLGTSTTNFYGKLAWREFA